MILQIVDILRKSSYQIEGDVIVLSNHMVEDITCLKYLSENNCFDNYLDVASINNGDIVNFDLKLPELSSIGVFENKESFIRRNKYTLLKPEYYILEIDCFQDADDKFIIAYGLIIDLIEAIKKNSRHGFADSDYEYSVIAKGDVSFVIPYNYGVTDVDLSDAQITALRNFISVLNETNEKKSLFLNELIEHIEKTTENSRFHIILRNIIELDENAEAAYLFYLSDFSSKKLKIEINTKLLEFSQKTQAIINDAQTKLIAIPVATIFAVSALDMSTLISIKNIAAIVSLLVFAILLDLFIGNQRTGLKFITNNVNNYKDELGAANIRMLHSEFKTLESDLRKQKNRLFVINCINWIIPGAIILIWLTLVLVKFATPLHTIVRLIFNV